MRKTRVSVKSLLTFSVSSSSSVIESIIVMNFLNRACESYTSSLRLHTLLA
jgi:hypothetical protein